MSKVFNGEVWQSTPVRAMVLVSALLAFTACGGAGGGSGISGQVSGPTGANLKQTEVAAFVCSGACQSTTEISNTIGGQTVISATGASASYQLPNVPTGKYFVLAIQDTNASGSFDSGDLAGSVSGVPSPAANVNIKLQAVTVNGANDPSLSALARRLLRER